MADAFGKWDVTTSPGFLCWESCRGSRGLLYLGSELPQPATALPLHTRAMTVSTEIPRVIAPRKYQPQSGEKKPLFLHPSNQRGSQMKTKRAAALSLKITTCCSYWKDGCLLSLQSLSNSTLTRMLVQLPSAAGCCSAKHRRNHHSSHCFSWAPQVILWQSEKCTCNIYLILEREGEKDWVAAERVIFLLCWTTPLPTSETGQITSNCRIIRYRESQGTQHDELCITGTGEAERRIPIFSPLNKYLRKPSQNGSSWLLAAFFNSVQICVSTLPHVKRDPRTI